MTMSNAKIIAHIVKKNYLEDRLEYAVEDLMFAYQINEAQALILYNLLRKIAETQLKNLVIRYTDEMEVCDNCVVGLDRTEIEVQTILSNFSKGCYKIANEIVLVDFLLAVENGLGD